MEKTLRELVDFLPDESLELFVMHYEAGEVGGYMAWSYPAAWMNGEGSRCPRACMGFTRGATSTYLRAYNGGNAPDMPLGHPAHAIERMAADHSLDTAALYTEAVLALTERDGAGLPEPEVVVG